jgi:aminoglycoside/choline kinase family phosphotransferase
MFFKYDIILCHITIKAIIMATFTSGQADSNQSFKPFPSGMVAVRYAKIDVTAAVNAADVYQMVQIFAGETVHDVKVKSSDLDAGTALVFDIGDDGDVDRYIDASTIGQAGGVDHEAADLVPQLYSADNTIDILCTVAPGTDVATGTLEMWVYVS